jgi:hypothetical protein
LGVYGFAYRDKKVVVGVFVPFFVRRFIGSMETLRASAVQKQIMAYEQF